MDINQQKLEQDLVRETEIKLDNKVNDEVDNKSEKDLLEQERQNNHMDKNTCSCGENCTCGDNCECDEDCECGEDCNCKNNCELENDRIDKDLLGKEESEFVEGGQSDSNEFDKEGIIEEQVVTEVTEEGKYPPTTEDDSHLNSDKSGITEDNYHSESDAEIINDEDLDEVKDDSYPFAPSDDYDTSDLFPYSEENILTEENDNIDNKFENTRVVDKDINDIENNKEFIDEEIDEYKIRKENIEEIERSHPEDNLD